MTRFTTYAALRAMSDADIIRDFDKFTDRGEYSPQFLREELARREADARAAKVERLSTQMRNLTWVILILTVANVVATAIALLIAPG